MFDISSKPSWNSSVLTRLQANAKVNTVGVGIPPDAQYPDGQKVYDVALRQEFGTARIPPRPFVRTAVQIVKSVIRTRLKEGIMRAKDSNDLVDMYRGVGKQLQQSVKAGIDMVDTPPLSEATIGRRRASGNRSEKPLIDTGRMRDSIAYRVGDGEWETE